MDLCSIFLIYMDIDIDQVRSPVGISSGTQIVLTFTIAPQSGSTVIVPVTQWDSGNGISSVVDNQGNTYLVGRNISFDSAGGRCAIFYAENVTSSGTFTITVTVPNGVDSQAMAFSVLGLSSSDSLLDFSTDVSSSFENQAQTGIVNSPDEAFYVALLGATSTYSRTSTWTDSIELADMTGDSPLNVQYLISDGDQECTWNLGGFSQWGAIILVFKKASVPPSSNQSNFFF